MILIYVFDSTETKIEVLDTESYRFKSGITEADSCTLTDQSKHFSVSSAATMTSDH